MSPRGAFVALLLLAAPVAAEAPVVSQTPCSVAQHCTKEEDGASCRASLRNPFLCRKDMIRDGWTFRCKTAGTKVWNEVYCRAKKK